MGHNMSFNLNYIKGGYRGFYRDNGKENGSYYWSGNIGFRVLV